MATSDRIVPIMGHSACHSYETPRFANYLPDELLIEILSYIPKGVESQGLLAQFCMVSRQWYDIAIRRLYESPHLAGKAFELFVRTICPSINLHIRKSNLAGLVKVLDLSHIVHQSNKATTARLLGRTKTSLEVFIAPQASFAVNCWAALSKCSNLKCLDLTLVSECISYQALNQTCRQLPVLTHLYFPRCHSNYDALGVSMNVKWPPRMEHLSLAGNVHGKFLWDMLNQPHNFPPTLKSLCISHAPQVDAHAIHLMLGNLSKMLTSVELRDLPAVKQGRLNGILEWCPNLESLTVAIDYIDDCFGNMPPNWEPSMWALSKPLQNFKLVSSGAYNMDPQLTFAPIDLFTLIDERFLRRLRVVKLAASLRWHQGDQNAELEVIETTMVEVDRENWQQRRWDYAELQIPADMTYDVWCNTTAEGRQRKPRLMVLNNQ